MSTACSTPHSQPRAPRDAARPVATARSPHPAAVRYRPALAWFAALGSAWVFVLVLLGALTTTIGAGMAFPDWPLSDGSVNPSGWLTDAARFAEHSHRLSGATMGLITLVLAIWVSRAETRRWVRGLAWAAVAIVIVQGVLGGQRVTLDAWHVPGFQMSVGQMLRVPHGILAQVFVMVLFAITAALSRPWIEAPAGTFAVRPAVRRLGVACTALVLVQLVIAATMRYSHAGLAIPTFPLTPQGTLLPVLWNFPIGIHFAHRVMAVVLLAGLTAYAVALWRDGAVAPLLKRGATVMIALLAVQILLGIAIIWTFRSPSYTTAHVVVGASTLGVTFLLTWLGYRDRLETGMQGDAAARAA
jgi:heme a synthase